MLTRFPTADETQDIADLLVKAPAEPEKAARLPAVVQVVQDRVTIDVASRSRLTEARFAGRTAMLPSRDPQQRKYLKASLKELK